MTTLAVSSMKRNTATLQVPYRNIQMTTGMLATEIVANFPVKSSSFLFFLSFFPFLFFFLDLQWQRCKPVEAPTRKKIRGKKTSI